jgi:hypothetical protein
VVRVVMPCHPIFRPKEWSIDCLAVLEGYDVSMMPRRVLYVLAVGSKTNMMRGAVLGKMMPFRLFFRITVELIPVLKHIWIDKYHHVGSWGECRDDGESGWSLTLT